MGKNILTINEERVPEKPEKITITSHRQKFARAAGEDIIKLSSKSLEVGKGSSLSRDSTQSSQTDKSGKSQSWCGLLSLCLALVACITGCYVMWGTNLFVVIVHQNVVISNNSMRYEAWRAPPIRALLRVYIFNYTNVEEFEQGKDSKLKIEELGPYTYIEKWERVDVRFNSNGTATYRDKKIYKFSREHSKGNETDILTVPNLPFLSAMALTTDMSSFFRWPFMQLINSIGGQPFISLKVGDFLWGYEDGLSMLAKRLLSFRYDVPFKKFGILSAKNGTQKDLVTIYTGEEDTRKTGVVASYGGKTSLNYWNSNECNRIDGTDGTVYPPPLVRPNGTLYLYLKDLCRKMPLVYSKKYSDQHGIEVLRFHVPKSVFASGKEKKENLCFCNQVGKKPNCLPSGVINVAPCVFDAPIVTSLPHFLHGDPILSKGVEGLKPDKKKHETFVEVDPKLGIPIGGKSRMQLNIMLNGQYGNLKRNRVYENQLLFPISWMDYGVDRLPDDISAMIRSLLSFIKVAEVALSYGFIISSLVLAIVFITGFRQRFECLNRSQTEDLSEGETPMVVIHEKR